MARPMNILPFTAEGAIAAYSIVKQGAADYGVLQAGAVSDALLGVTTEIAAASGERCDVIACCGTAYVKLGGAVTRGGYITTDAAGLGVTAAPAAGVNNEVVGRALQSGVADDVIEITICPCRIQG